MKNEKMNAGSKASLASLAGYLLSDLTHPAITKNLRILLWTGLGVVLFWLFYFALTTILLPYQLEYREGAAQVTTQILLGGGNPFSAENQPLALNNYGITYNLVVLPLAAAFGNTLLVHRTVSFLFILLSSLLVLQTISSVNTDFYFAAAGALIIWIGLASLGGNGAYPSAMGEFLFLAAILIPFNESFDFLPLGLSAVLCLIAYYTKPYFALSFGIVASYVFLFVSKKKGLLYALLFAGLFLASYLAVRFFAKYYFVDTVISNVSNDTRPSFYIVYVQLVEAFREFYPGILLALVVWLLHLPALRRRAPTREGLASRLDLWTADRPLFLQRLSYFGYFFVVSLLAFILVLGQHSGSIMTYVYQLLLPPFFLWLFQYLKPSSRLALISLGVLLLNILLFGGLRSNPAFLSQKDSPQWAALYKYVDGSKRILNTPVITSEMVRVGLLPVDSGQTEFYYHINPYANNKLIGPNYDVVKMNGSQYKAAVHNSVTGLQYDKVIVTAGDYSFAPSDLSKYYARIDALTVEMPQTGQEWDIEIWEPIQNQGSVKP